MWLFSLSLKRKASVGNAALKKEVLDLKLLRFHSRNVKEKGRKMLRLGKYRLGIKKTLKLNCSS